MSRAELPCLKIQVSSLLNLHTGPLPGSTESRPTGKAEDAKRLRAQECETGRSAAKMRRRVLVLLLVLEPMEILRERGNASFWVEYEYRPSG